MDFLFEPHKELLFLLDENKVDFLTQVQNVSWDSAIKNVKYFPFYNIQVPIVGYHDLILMKIASSRLKDQADVEELQKIVKYRGK